MKKSKENISSNPLTFNGKEKELEKKLMMSYEKNRKDTFKSWTFSENKKCNAAKLAEAGFYYIGNETEPDSVQCFFCDKALDGWEESDDPWIEHKNHSSECKFVQLYTPECKLTVYEFITIQIDLATKWVQKLFETRRTEIEEKHRLVKKALQGLKK